MNIYDEEEEEEDDGNPHILMSEHSEEHSLSSGPSTTSLENVLEQMSLEQDAKYDQNEIDKLQINVKKSNKLQPTLRKPRRKYIMNEYKENKEDESIANGLYLSLSSKYSNKSKDETPLNLQTPDQIYDEMESYKMKRPIAGYIDFFDDNETSIESKSISNSIGIEEMFEVIGLKSPPIHTMNALYSSEDDENADSHKNKNHPIKLGLVQNSDGELVVMDKNGKIITTPEGDEFDAFSSSSTSTATSSDDQQSYNEENIVSSYVRTENADMIDDDCLPKSLYLKYIPTPNKNNEIYSHSID